MSRRKQLNPNKVHLGDNGSEEKGDLSQTSQATLTGLVDESRIQEDDDAEIESKTQTENGAESETEVITTTAQGTAVILPNNPESVDLSSVKSMMSTVMNMGSLNGEAGEMPSNKSPSKSSIRAGKIKQEAKEEKSFFICPLCEKDCGTQHQLTMHIRQHNTDSGGNTHSCSICGKSLSSASSLDRHMLVHSGERPYKCSICHQAFTTNGNMHRHMKIHEKEPTSSLGSSPPSPTKRRRPSVKRKLSQEEGEAKEEESPSKKVTREVPSDEEEEKKTEEVLHCPICYKTFICKYGLESHMETHPDSTLRCNLCCISFKTHRGLLRHNAIIHKQLPTDVSGKPYIQNNPTIPVGFHDLGFIDFSCRKFPLISQVWSELNLRRCTSKFHRFVCELCNKAFPMLAALKLHLETHRGQLEGGQGLPEPQQMPDVDEKQKAFMASLGLQHAKEAKAVKREETTEFDIHTIWAETPPWKLPQEANCATVKDQPPLDLASLGASLSSLSPLQDKVKILSLHPFQKGFIIQPDSSIVVKPISSESTIEFADIQQILKMASSAPTQISLPPLSKAPSIPNQSIYRQMPPLKPKPLVAPCTVVASTPPPLMSSQQASPGCISPNLFPPPLKLVKTVAGPLCSPQDLKVKPVNGAQPFLQPKTEPLSPVEMKTQLEQDSIIEALMPMEMNGAIKQEVMEGDLKDMMTGTSSKKVPALKKVLYPCRFCNQVFAFSGVLKAHIRSHLGISPYQCNICTYIAADKAALIRHLRTHSGERPFICKICHYPFTVKANCERHLRKKHLKMTRKDIEKNIEYAESHTAELVDSFCSPDTVCKYCGEDLKYYRALRHHLRTHSSCQKKPFECRECNMGFSTKNNCIRHILKQHTHVEEKEMEKHILLVDCLMGENGAVSPTLSEESVSANGSPVSCKEPQNGFMHGSLPQGSLKMEPMGIFSMDLDEPLDFSQKNKNVSFHSYKQECHLLRKHASPIVAQFDSTLEPIDLSVPKNPPKDKTNLGKENKDENQLVVNGGSFACQQCPSNFQAKTSLDKHVSTKHSSPLQGLVPTRNPATLPAVVASTSMLRPLRPKPPPPLLLPKPAAGKELPPLASIAQIISSVSSAPALLKRDVKDGAEANKPTPSSDGAEDLKIGLATKAAPQTGTNGPAKPLAPQHTTEKTSAGATGPGKRKGRRRSLKFKKIRPSVSSSGVDPESSGEFASVEKMLATTDTNKFSPFLQSTSVKEEPEKEEKDSQGNEKGDIITLKGKKNSYSNSVQKITCPYCPRLFPWASSLQRHMLTHTGNVPESETTVTEASPAPAAAAACPSPGPTERPGAEGPTGESEPKAESEAAVRAKGGTEEEEEEEEQEQQQEAEEDAQSNKSLDLDFASKLIDFKLGGPDPGAAPAEGRNSCGVCGKTFKYAATLARHRKAHACERRRDRDARRGPRPAAEQPGALRSRPAKSAGASRSDGPPPRREDDVEEEEEAAAAAAGAGAGGGAPGARAPQPPTAAGQLELRKAPPSGSNKADKRKKICAVCSKRFWSLQDLTRHMRSHTGERPYKCLTCERTFTLKHSLVRHQRIHQKGAKVAKRHPGENDDELSKDEDDSESEAEQAGSSQLSDNESETVTSISLSNDSPLPLSIAGSPVTATTSQSPSQLGVKAAEPENSLIRPATAVNGVRQGTFLIQGNDQESLKNSEKTLADSTGSSDIIQNFLGIPSGAPMNHVLGSVESTPCLLGVE